MASKALHAAWRRSSTHLMVLDGYAGRVMLGRCRSRLSHFPKTYTEGAGSSESNAAPPRPDPLRVWARIAPSFAYYGVYKHLFVIRGDPGSRISIIGVTSSSGAGLCGVPGEDDSKGIGAGICKILDMNFREFLFHALR